MENPCLRCHTCAAALSHSDAIIGFGVVASRARLHEWWTAISADAVAYSKINSVVLQFNDWWLRRGWSQRNARRFSRLSASCRPGNVGHDRNLRDLIPEVVETSTRTLESRTRSERIRKFNFTRKFFEPKRKSGD